MFFSLLLIILLCRVGTLEGEKVEVKRIGTCDKGDENPLYHCCNFHDMKVKDNDYKVERKWCKDKKVPGKKRFKNLLI